MEVSAEAKRIMVVALGKLYSSRTQRGGLRLHRSLLLTLVMKSARDIYHEAQVQTESVVNECQQPPPTQQSVTQGTTEASRVDLLGPALLTHENPLMLSVGDKEEEKQERAGAQNKENQCPNGSAQQSRKRRGREAAEPDFLPCKKAKLEQGNCLHQLTVTPVLMDYMKCSSELAAHPSPTMTLHRAVAACWTHFTSASLWNTSRGIELSYPVQGRPGRVSSGSWSRETEDSAPRATRHGCQQARTCSRNHGSRREVVLGTFGL